MQDFGRRNGVYPLVINREYAQTADPLVTLYLYGQGIWTEMRLRNDDGTWSEWRPFTSTVSWRLNWINGERTVCAELRRDNQSVQTCDSIELTANPPRLEVQSTGLLFIYNRAKNQVLPNQAVVRLSNVGNNEPLTWQAETSMAWVRLVPSANVALSDEIRVNPDSSQMPISPGTYAGAITVRVINPATVEGSPAQVEIYLIVVEDLPYAVFLPAVMC